MGSTAYTVRTIPKFDRLFEALVKKHIPIINTFDEVLVILRLDPHNYSRQYKIKKLSDVDDAVWRVGVGEYRIRYDIVGSTVWLKSIRHRRDSYRSNDR